MSISETYVLVEGVNIVETLLDTDQLSVIRGTSFLYKTAIEFVAETFSEALAPLSTGASSGLFMLRSSQTEKAITTRIEEALRTHPQLSLLTILVVSESSPSLLEAKERLLAKLRFLQLQHLSQVPDLNAASATSPCGIEGTRGVSAHRQLAVRGTKRPVSDSVFLRWQYGREQRNSYYQNLLNDAALADLSFTDDFESLAACDDFPHLNQQLNNKVAVIYIDGNGFGALQRRVLQAAEESGGSAAALDAQRHFDQRISEFHKAFLLSILQELQSNQRFPEAINRHGQLCFETLLWGGDEMLFVMPARFGFEFIQAFFQQAATWFIDIPDVHGGFESVPLTYSAGVVFCHAKTPIRITRELARSMLADRMKASMRASGLAMQNVWDYLVLESIDYPVDSDFDAYTATRYGALLAASRPAFIPPCDDWATPQDSSAIRQALHDLLQDELLPNSRLYDIVTTIVDSHTLSHHETSMQDIAKAIQRLYTLAGNDEAHLKDALHYCAQLFALDFAVPREQAWVWLHLLELKDYIFPLVDSPATDLPPTTMEALA